MMQSNLAIQNEIESLARRKFYEGYGVLMKMKMELDCHNA